MVILGIDPGFGLMGYGLVAVDEKGKLSPVHYGTLTTSPRTPAPKRLQKVFEQVESLVETYRPDAVAVEELFFNTNTKTAIMVAQARGAILVAAAKANLPLYEYTPVQVKQAVVGYGRGDKNQIQQMVKILLALDAPPKNDDAADALAVAICHAHNRNMQKLFAIR